MLLVNLAHSGEEDKKGTTCKLPFSPTNAVSKSGMNPGEDDERQMLLHMYCFCLKTSNWGTYAKCLTMKRKFRGFFCKNNQNTTKNKVQTTQQSTLTLTLSCPEQPRCESQRAFTPCTECNRYTSDTWLQPQCPVSCDTMRGQRRREHYLNCVTSIKVWACRLQTKIFMQQFLMLPPTGPVACETCVPQNHNILSVITEKLADRRSRSCLFFK